MPASFQDQVVVITGASAGIGAALTSELDRRGARLVLVARRREPLEALASRLREALPVAADVTRREQVEAVMAAALARFGRVDTWINNAGRGITRPLAQLTGADVDDMLAVNVKSALYGMQAVLPHADGLAAGRADINTRPQGLEMVLGHLRGLAGA